MRLLTMLGVGLIAVTILTLGCQARETSDVAAPTDATAVAREKGGGDETGPYEVVPNWPQPVHEDWTWGRTPAVWAESPNKVYVLQSAELPNLDQPIGTGGVPVRGANEAQAQGVLGRDYRFEHHLMIFDREGKLIDSWERHNDLIGNSHRLGIDPYDPEKHIWILTRTHQVLKFTNDGELVMTLGEFNVSGRDPLHLNFPTEMAFLPDGDFLINDARNFRVVRFSKDGKYLSEFGKQGTGPGEFGSLLHGIAVDAEQRVYIADRGNQRIQVFDTNGTFLDEWPGIRFPCYVGVSEDQFVWVADGLTNKILKFDTNGNLLYSWGTFGGELGQLFGAHHLSTDSDGTLYVTEVWGGRVQKFRPKPGADPNKLVGQLFWQ